MKKAIIFLIPFLLCCFAIGITLVSCGKTNHTDDLLEIPLASIQTMDNTVEEGINPDSFLQSPENVETIHKLNKSKLFV